MLSFSSEYLRGVVKNADPENATIASQVDSIDFLEFGHLEDSIKSDVKFLKDSPLVLKESVITGWVYEVETGKVCDK
jgi:carbonic anhydrase